MRRTSIGKHNPRLVEIRKAFESGGFTADGLLPIEGLHLLEEAQRSDIEIVELFLCEDVANSLATQSTPKKIYVLSHSVFRSISETRNPQGVLALISPPQFDLDKVLNSRDPENHMLVVLCGIQDPGNVGAILRLAEAFGATGCIATPGTAGQYNAKVVRASAGSIFRLPGIWDIELTWLADKMRSVGIQIIGTSPTGTTAVDSQDWHQPTALLLGNEGAGLGNIGEMLCDAVLRISHSENVESLNAASAAAVILHEAYWQRSRRSN